jgi:hypothetical protein
MKRDETENAGYRKVFVAKRESLSRRATKAMILPFPFDPFHPREQLAFVALFVIRT